MEAVSGTRAPWGALPGPDKCQVEVRAEELEGAVKRERAKAARRRKTAELGAAALKETVVFLC